MILDQLLCTEHIHLKGEPKIVEFIYTFNSLNKEQNSIICVLVTFSNHAPLNRKGFILVLDKQGNVQISSWIFKG